MIVTPLAQTYREFITLAIANDLDDVDTSISTLQDRHERLHDLSLHLIDAEVWDRARTSLARRLARRTHYASGAPYSA